MLMPLADLPIRCSRVIRGWGRLDRLGVRCPLTFPFLRFLSFLRLLVLLIGRNQPHGPGVMSEAQAEWWAYLLPSPNRPETIKETHILKQVRIQP